MATPTPAATLDVELTGGGTQQFTDVGYYVHRDGLDIVDPASGEYLDRFRPDEYEGYAATTTPAEATAA